MAREQKGKLSGGNTLQDLLWKISIRRKGSEYNSQEAYITSNVSFYLGANGSQTVKIGNTAAMDIRLSQAFPHHATLQLTADQFCCQAHKKLICQQEEKSRILTKGQQWQLALPTFAGKEDQLGCTLKIRDSSIKSLVMRDDRVLDRTTPAYSYLRQKHGELSKVAEGNISFIYRTDLGKPLIFKLLKTEFHDPKHIERFLWAAETAQRLQHEQLPLVVEIIHQADVGIYGYVMESFAGTSLQQRMACHKRLEAGPALIWLQQLAQFLHYLHQQGKIHRNLTPENLLIDSESNCRVVGLTFLRSPNVKGARPRKSTLYPGFIAPEEIENPEAVDVTADIFSFGALFYYLLTGSPPFGATSIKDYRQIIAAGLPQPTFPENWEWRQFEAVISRCLARQPQHRFSSLVELWRQLTSQDSTAALKPLAEHSAPPPQAETTTTRPSLSISAVAAAAAVAPDPTDSDPPLPAIPVPTEALSADPQPGRVQPQRLVMRASQNTSSNKTFGKFLIKKELGRGAVGVVYRAFDTQLQRQVALKMLLCGQIADADEVERFMREAKSASTLSHPNIVTIYEVGEQEHNFYIAMQLIEGTNLQAYQEASPLQPRQALIIVRDIARALHQAHGHGIIHRDVKPSNIMIDAQGKPYLMDFGLAKDMRSEYTLTRSGEVVGTLIYMAPELLDGYPPSPLQDIYSLGVILYELLTGHRLIEGISSVEIMAKIVNVEPTLRKLKPKIASDAETICLKALEKLPARRYQSAKAFADDIDCFLECRPITARPPSIRYRFYKKLVRHRGVAAVSLVSTLALLLLSLYSFVIYPVAEKQRQLQSLREVIADRYGEFRRCYTQKMDQIPLVPDPVGMSAESQETEKQASVQMRTQTKIRYRHALVAEVLPLLRQSWQLGRQEADRSRLLQLLAEIIELCQNEQQRRQFRVERLQLQNEDSRTLDIPATVRIRKHPATATLHLYKFYQSKDGRNKLLPFSPEQSKLLALTAAQRQRLVAHEEFLRCQNLLWEAAFHMLNQNFFVATTSLRRSIEINPQYIDAYLLLCCAAVLSNRGKVDNNSSLESWRQAALKRIATAAIAAKTRKKLATCFTLDFINRLSDIYSILPQRNYQDKIDYLVRITALPLGDYPLQVGDYFLKIDDQAIVSEFALAKSLKNKNKVSCVILRDFELQQLTIAADFYSDNYFQVVEQAPIFFIYANSYLGFDSSESIYPLITSAANRIRHDKITLDCGDYLLLCQSHGYLSLRYPFQVFRETVFGRPEAQPILLSLPPCPPECQSLFADFVAVPRGVVKGEAKWRNTMGYLLGRYEVTIGEWLDYLRGINGSGPWQPSKLKGRLPLITPSRPLLHFRAGKLVLRLGEKTWPVFGINHKQIADYLDWRNQTLPPILQKSGFRFRLPTMEEWRAAAVGADARVYPWGNFPNHKFCKILGARCYRVYQEPVAKYNPAFRCDESPYGVNDMGGSLSEYTGSGKFSGANILYGIKGSGWSDSRLVDVDQVWYSSNIISRVSRGFRIGAGLDPLYDIGESRHVVGKE